MYPAELEIQDTMENNTSAPYLDFFFAFQSSIRLSACSKWNQMNIYLCNLKQWI